MRLPIYFILTIVLFSCKKVENESSAHTPEVLNVPLGKEKLNASKIFEEINYLRLKGNGDLYPSKADQLEILNNEIFIMDKSLGSIFRFSSNGDLLGTLNNQGEGPEEYQYLHRFLIDNTNQTIEIYDKVGQKIIVYDKEFKFIESFKIGLFFENFTKIGDRKYLVYTAQDNIYNDELLENNLLIWNDEVIEFSAIPKKGTDSKFQIRGLNPLISNNQIFISQSFSDTIFNYSISENLLKNNLYIEFEYPLNQKFNSVDEIHDYALSHTFSTAIDNLLFSKEIISFNYINFENGRMRLMSYYYFSQLNKHISSQSLYNDFDNFNLFKHSNLINETFINVIEPDYLSMINIENTSKGFQNSIDLNLPFEDQMIVLFLKLKDPSTIDFN